MMGSRAVRGGDDFDAFSRRGRRIVRWKRGEVAQIKRRFWKWNRREKREAVQQVVETTPV